MAAAAASSSASEPAMAGAGEAVGRVLGRRMVGGRRLTLSVGANPFKATAEYLLSWTGKKLAQVSWVSEALLPPGLLAQFEGSRKKRAGQLLSDQQINQKASATDVETLNSGFFVDKNAQPIPSGTSGSASGGDSKAPTVRARTLPSIGVDEPTREYPGDWSESSEEADDPEPAGDKEFRDDEGNIRRSSRVRKAPSKLRDESDDMDIDDGEKDDSEDKESEDEFEEKDSDEDSGSEKGSNSASVSDETRINSWKKTGPIAPKDSKLYEVEKIVNELSVKGVKSYEVKWKGRSDREKTIEPETNIHPELIDNYFEDKYGYRPFKTKRGATRGRKIYMAAMESTRLNTGRGQRRKAAFRGRYVDGVEVPEVATKKVVQRKLLTKEPCAKCKARGESLIGCSSCTRLYHLRCTKLTTATFNLVLATGGWTCDACLKHRCALCDKVVLGADVSKELQRCSLCSSYYHPGCWENPKLANGAKHTKEEFAKIKEQRLAAKEERRKEKEEAREAKAAKKAEKDSEGSSDSSSSSSSSDSSPSSDEDDSSSSSEDEAFDSNFVCPDCVAEQAYWDAGTISNAVDMILNSQPAKDNGRDATAYLVKWKERSHVHDTWLLERRLRWHAAAKLKNFNERKLTDEEGIQELLDHLPKWTKVDRVIWKEVVDDIGGIKYYVKWTDLGYSECTWETAETVMSCANGLEEAAAYESREERARANLTLASANRKKEPKKEKKTLDSAQKLASFKQVYKSQPYFVKGGELYSYQLDGLNFLHSAWLSDINVILADEMGLGKTCQAICYMSSIRASQGNKSAFRPFLVVCPLSVVPNWKRELKFWAPEFNVVTFTGNEADRKVIRDFEFFNFDSNNKPIHEDIPKFDVLILNFENANKNEAGVRKFEWESMVVDEGHRIKNVEGLAFNKLNSVKARHRVLLTGTPMQNNTKELFTLLNFLDPEYNIEELEEEYASLDEEGKVAELHALLKPHILRRVKDDVMKEVPEKTELVVPISVTKLQRELYIGTVTKDYSKLRAQAKSTKSLNNIMSVLRKIVDHPYLFGPEVEEKTPDKAEELKRLVEASGKMLVLDKMLGKLRAQGHRVLIFSHMTNMLDILEDYLQLKNYTYVRLDGDVDVTQRQHDIDKFNDPSQDYFCYLISTRAGGLGINLASADTVILFDFWFNPHDEKQAIARAHRIGQRKKVMVYQFVTKDSIEEGIIESQKRKLALENVVVANMDKKLNQSDLATILKFGMKKMFSEDGEVGDAQFEYDDVAIDKLLDRTQKGEVIRREGKAEGFLGTFNIYDEARVRDQKIAEELAKKEAEADEFWETVLKERFQKAEDEQRERELQELETNASRPRRRAAKQTVNYNVDNDSLAKRKRGSLLVEIEGDEMDESAEDGSSEEGDGQDGEAPRKKRRTDELPFAGDRESEEEDFNPSEKEEESSSSEEIVSDADEQERPRKRRKLDDNGEGVAAIPRKSSFKVASQAPTKQQPSTAVFTSPGYNPGVFNPQQMAFHQQQMLATWQQQQRLAASNPYNVITFQQGAAPQFQMTPEMIQEVQRRQFEALQTQQMQQNKISFEEFAAEMQKQGRIATHDDFVAHLKRLYAIEQQKLKIEKERRKVEKNERKLKEKEEAGKVRIEAPKQKVEKVEEAKTQGPEAKSRKRKREDDDSPRPKKFLSAYNVFMRDNSRPLADQFNEKARAGLLPQVKVVDKTTGEERLVDVKPDSKELRELQMKELGQRWRNLTPEERAKYDKVAEQDRSRFNEELEAMKAKAAEEAKRAAENPAPLSTTLAPSTETKPASDAATVNIVPILRPLPPPPLLPGAVPSMPLVIAEESGPKRLLASAPPTTTILPLTFTSVNPAAPPASKPTKKAKPLPALEAASGIQPLASPPPPSALVEKSLEKPHRRGRPKMTDEEKAVALQMRKDAKELEDAARRNPRVPANFVSTPQHGFMYSPQMQAHSNAPQMMYSNFGYFPMYGGMPAYPYPMQMLQMPPQALNAQPSNPHGGRADPIALDDDEKGSDKMDVEKKPTEEPKNEEKASSKFEDMMLDAALGK